MLMVGISGEGRDEAERAGSPRAGKWGLTPAPCHYSKKILGEATVEIANSLALSLRRECNRDVTGDWRGDFRGEGQLIFMIRREARKSWLADR